MLTPVFSLVWCIVECHCCLNRCHLLWLDASAVLYGGSAGGLAVGGRNWLAELPIVNTDPIVNTKKTYYWSKLIRVTKVMQTYITLRDWVTEINWLQYVYMIYFCWNESSIIGKWFSLHHLLQGPYVFTLKWAGMSTSTVWCGKRKYDKLCVNGK